MSDASARQVCDVCGAERCWGLNYEPPCPERDAKGKRCAGHLRSKGLEVPDNRDAKGKRCAGHLRSKGIEVPDNLDEIVHQVVSDPKVQAEIARRTAPYRSGPPDPVELLRVIGPTRVALPLPSPPSDESGLSPPQGDSPEEDEGSTVDKLSTTDPQAVENLMTALRAIDRDPMEELSIDAARSEEQPRGMTAIDRAVIDSAFESGRTVGRQELLDRMHALMEVHAKVATICGADRGADLLRNFVSALRGEFAR